MAHTVDWRGGASLGGAGCLSPRATWPGGHLVATEAGIEFEMETIFPFCPSRCFLEKSSVIAVREYCGLWLTSRGVQVVHSDKKSPPFVVLWTLSPKRLLRELQALGYPVGKRRWWWDTLMRPEESEV